MSIHVVLVQPEIHWNTGNAGRTCLATGATLHLVEHERYRDRFLAMPMASPLVRSLNLSTSVGIAVYEVLRQRRG